MRSIVSPRALAALAVAALGGAAVADINPMSGTQSLHGFTRINRDGAPVATGGFDLSAPDAMQSWAPPTQIGDITAAGSFVELSSSWATTISPTEVSLATLTRDELAGNPDVPSDAVLEFAGLFDLEFAIATAGVYTLRASIQRAADPLSTPATITFGPSGGAAIVSLSNAGSPWPPGTDVMFPQTTLTLGPGTYTLHALDEDSRSGGPHSYLHHSKLDFSLVLVPAPGATAVGLVGLVGWTGRRRR